MSTLDTRLQSLVEDIRLLNETHHVAIAAIDPWLGIGRDGDLLYKNSKDFQFFKAVTMGREVVMGRKTFQSIPNGLPGRKVTVITGSQEPIPGVRQTKELSSVLHLSGPSFICGGARVYKDFLQLSKVAGVDSYHVLTTFHAPAQLDADKHYPRLAESFELEYIEQVVIPADGDQMGFTVSLIKASPDDRLKRPVTIHRFNHETSHWCYGKLEGDLFFDFYQGQTFSIRHSAFA